MKNPSGYCMCGCGEKTAPCDRTARGYKRGEPMQFVRGHSLKLARKNSPEYLEEDRGYKTACWIWQLSTTSWGYGHRWDPETGKTPMAHRTYYERHIGPIPKGHDIHHLCEQPACVNPEHLVAVTRREHMAIEGRRPFGNPKAPIPKERAA